MQTAFPPKLDAAMSHLKLESTRPIVAQVILDWWDEEKSKALYEVKRSGSGQQIVLKYSAEAFKAILNMAYFAASQRSEMTKKDRESYIVVLVATGLFTADNLGVLMSISRGTISSWKTKRSPFFPVRRIGGHATLNTIVIVSQYWVTIEDPQKKDEAIWSLCLAQRNGDDLALLARCTGMSSINLRNNMDRIQRKADEGKVSVNINVIAGNRPALSEQVAPRRAGHDPLGSEYDGPEEQDIPDFESESLIRPPVTVDDGNADAFAPAIYLAPDSEATDGDAGQSDAAPTRLHQGSEDDRRDEPSHSERGVHPFFQPE